MAEGSEKSTTNTNSSFLGAGWCKRKELPQQAQASKRVALSQEVTVSTHTASIVTGTADFPEKQSSVQLNSTNSLPVTEVMKRYPKLDINNAALFLLARADISTGNNAAKIPKKSVNSSSFFGSNSAGSTQQDTVLAPSSELLDLAIQYAESQKTPKLFETVCENNIDAFTHTEAVRDFAKSADNQAAINYSNGTTPAA